jgi:hypothetical protein
MKKNSYSNFIIGITMLTTVLSISCRKEQPMIKTTISLIGLQKAQLDTFNRDGGTTLDIIEKFPSQKESNSIEKYANVYICCKSSNQDTVYVFEECHKVNLQMYSDTISCMGIVDKYNLSDFKSDKIITFMPINFKINHGIKYFSAKFKILSEY